MKNTNELDNQAVSLKEMMDQIQQDEPKPDINEQNENKEDSAPSMREIDVLNLPPRKAVHGKNNKRTKLKVRRPAIRLITIFLILIIVLAVGYFYFYDEILSLFN